jgi:hypothetical protein
MEGLLVRFHKELIDLAFMLQDNVLMIGGLKDIKSFIFVFSYYGKLINVINVRSLLL